MYNVRMTNMAVTCECYIERKDTTVYLDQCYHISLFTNYTGFPCVLPDKCHYVLLFPLWTILEVILAGAAALSSWEYRRSTP